MNRTLANILGNILSAMGVALSESQLDQLEHITAIVCMVVGLLITITSSVLIPLYKWWKKAKKDGKIDDEEIKEAEQIVKNGSESIKDNLKDFDK